MKSSCLDCPGGLLIKNLCFQCKSIPGQGTTIPHTRQYSKKEKKKNLSYSDPTGQNPLQGTAGCAPDWKISSQTRSPPPLLCSTRQRMASRPPWSPHSSSGWFSGRRWFKTELSFWTRLPSGFSSLSSALVEPQSVPSPEGSSPPSQHSLKKQTRSAFLAPLLAPEKEAGWPPEQGARDISEERKGPPEGTTGRRPPRGRVCFRGRDSRSHRDPHSRRVRSPP